MVDLVQRLDAVRLRDAADAMPRSYGSGFSARRSQAKPPGLTPEEEALAALLAPALRRRPRRRRAGGLTEADDTQPMEPDTGEAIPVPEAEVESRNSSPLPTFSDEPEDRNTTVRTVTWLHRSRWAGWRERLKTMAAWLITLAVIVTIVSTATLALIGPGKEIGRAHV